MNKKLSLMEKLAFSSGDMAINFLIASIVFFLPYFYTDIYGIAPLDMGMLLLFARLFDAITNPIMGFLIDKYSTELGKYRHYFLYMAVPFGMSFVLLFLTPDLEYNAKLVWVYSVYLIVSAVLTGVAVPYISYISVLTDCPKERLSANGYRLFFARVASVVFVSSVPVIIGYFDEYGDAFAYQITMFIFGTIAIFLLLICYKFTNEKISTPVETGRVLIKLKYLVRNDQWLVLCAVALVGTLGYGIRGSVAMYYALYYLDCTKVQASWFISSGIAMSMVSMIASTWITKYICKIKVFFWSQTFGAAICIAIYLIVSPGDIWLAFALNLLLCLVVDLQAPIFWSAIADAVDYGEKKSRKGIAGLSFSVISLAQKIGGSISGFVLGFLLSYYQYQPGADQQTSTTIHGMAVMLVLIPAACHALMAILITKYKITHHFYEREIRSSINDEDLGSSKVG